MAFWGINLQKLQTVSFEPVPCDFRIKPPGNTSAHFHLLVARPGSDKKRIPNLREAHFSGRGRKLTQDEKIWALGRGGDGHSGERKSSRNQARCFSLSLSFSLLGLKTQLEISGSDEKEMPS